MDKWITIKTFTHPIEVAVIRARLESEGIVCFLKNEAIIQMNPFYSNAVGGVELQVRESDLQDALTILRDGGYLPDEDGSPSALLPKLDVITSKIPVLKRFQLVIRVIVLLAIFVWISILGFVYATLPTTYERLTSNTWCLDYLVYNNTRYIPQTNNSLRLVGAGTCDESISFRQNGTVIFPGFKSRGVWGHWTLENELVHISQADTFGLVLNGTYEPVFTENRLILKSATTTLACHLEVLNINVPF